MTAIKGSIGGSLLSGTAFSLYIYQMKKIITLYLLVFVMALTARSQTGTYKIYAIRFAASAYPFVAADWAKDGSKTDGVKIDFMIWLIRGNGKNILVDAGFLGDMEDAKEFKVVNYVRPDSAIARLGLPPGDITDIILSHPHWDHI